jgi:hypothetical protein
MEKAPDWQFYGRLSSTFLNFHKFLKIATFMNEKNEKSGWGIFKLTKSSLIARLVF